MHSRLQKREAKGAMFDSSVDKFKKTFDSDHSITNRRTAQKSGQNVATRIRADHYIVGKPQFSGTKSTTTYYSRDTVTKVHDRLLAKIGTDVAKPKIPQVWQLNKEIERKIRLSVKRVNSPLKVPAGFKTGATLLKNAKVSKRAASDRSVSEKQKIVQNIYYKNDKYYYSNKIQFSTVLQKIYYENYKINDIKEYILPCFKRLSTVRAYFDILFREAKSFSETVKRNITSKIEKLITRDDPDPNDPDSSPDFRFMAFSKACKKYEKTIDLLHDNYRHLEAINVEIEKLTRIYLENYVEKNKPLSFDTLLFHRSMFINNVYKDDLIHSFIEFLFDYFKEKTFYWNNFPKAVEKISEIFENLEFNFNFDDTAESHKEDGACQTDMPLDSPSSRGAVMVDESEDALDRPHAKKAKKNKKKKKKAKKTAEGDSPNPANARESDEADPLYTLLCSKMDTASHIYGRLGVTNKPVVVFDGQTQARFEGLIVNP